jgi:hypothetical protein
MTESERTQILERQMRFGMPSVDGRLPEVTPELLALLQHPEAPIVFLGPHRILRRRSRLTAWLRSPRPFPATGRQQVRV